MNCEVILQWDINDIVLVDTRLSGYDSACTVSVTYANDSQEFTIQVIGTPFNLIIVSKFRN